MVSSRLVFVWPVEGTHESKHSRLLVKMVPILKVMSGGKDQVISAFKPLFKHRLDDTVDPKSVYHIFGNINQHGMKS